MATMANTSFKWNHFGVVTVFKLATTFTTCFQHFTCHTIHMQTYCSPVSPQLLLFLMGARSFSLTFTPAVSDSKIFFGTTFLLHHSSHNQLSLFSTRNPEFSFFLLLTFFDLCTRVSFSLRSLPHWKALSVTSFWLVCKLSLVASLHILRYFPPWKFSILASWCF